MFSSYCNQNFFIRAFAINSIGIAYGNQVAITAGLPPIMDTVSINSNIGVSVTVNSAIIDDRGCAITERGFCWSRTVNPIYFPFHVQLGNGLGTFSTTLSNLIPNSTYYVRTYAITVNGTFYGPEKTFMTTNTSGLAIGQNYAGGIIFYLDSSMQHGLVSAAQDQGAFPWGCFGVGMSTIGNVGAGAQNTATIVALCGDSNTAAKVCDNFYQNGYSDWYLPSSGEFSLIYLNLITNGIGNFNYGTVYWTSTECDVVSALRFHPLDGSVDCLFKSYSYPVRAIRTF